MKLSVYIIYIALYLQIHAYNCQQWYKLDERGGEAGEDDFPGSFFDIWSLFQDKDDQSEFLTNDSLSNEAEHDFVVYFGGAILRRQPALVPEEDFAAWGDFVKAKIGWLQDVRVLKGKEYELYRCIDFAASRPVPFAVEVAQLMVQTQSWANHEWREVTMGTVVALEVEGWGEEPEQKKNIYRMILNVDQAQLVSVTHFTAVDGEGATSGGREEHPIFGSAASSAAATGTKEGDEAHCSTDEASAELEVVSYNIWHHMPPPWVYSDLRQRRERYMDRMRHLARIVVEHGPDVVYFQEVRLDSSFRISGADAGSQVDHLYFFLAEAEREAGTCTTEGVGCTHWNVVYQPAMSMIDKNKVRSRHEEGLAIFSRLPLKHPAFLLLPRDLSKSSDDHSRAVLAASVSVPLLGTGKGERSAEVTLMTSHFSLDAAAREGAVSFLYRHSPSPQTPTVFGGDLNGEAEEQFMRMLCGQEAQGENEETGKVSRRENVFEDAFVASLLAEGGSTVVTSGSGSAWRHNGFTFPTCNPEKRIDFLLMRNASSVSAKTTKSCGVGTIGVTRFTLLGADHAGVKAKGGEETLDVEVGIDGSPMPEIGGRKKSVGMLDSDSHVWASDHFGIAASFRISFEQK